VWNNEPEQIVSKFWLPVPITNSNIQGGWQGQGNIDRDPRFAFATDYHLMPDSPCIDAGTNKPTGGLPATDIEAKHRPVDGDQDGTAVADMGAYEHVRRTPLIALSSRSISFSYAHGGANAEPQTLQIRNCGWQTLNWQIVRDCEWLDVTAQRGVSTGQINEVVLSVKPHALARGDYRCYLKVLDQKASNSPALVKVDLQVGSMLDVPEQFPTIQAAVDAAHGGDVIVIAPGRYTGDGNRDIDSHGKSITIRGTEPDNPSIVAATIIDCNATWQDKHRAFYFHDNLMSGAVLAGLRLTNACWSEGGAVQCRQANLNISDCVIVDNVWAGIYSSRSKLSVVRCILESNNRGIVASYGRSAIASCALIKNEQGIRLSTESAIVRNCIISKNMYKGIACQRSRAQITNCIVSGNGASTGIQATDSILRVSRSTINDNFRTGILATGKCSVSSCDVSGNSDGGIRVEVGEWWGSLRITNSRVSNNFRECCHAVPGGAGICCGPGATALISGCRICGNSAMGGYARGGGILANATIVNSIVAGNAANGPYAKGGGVYILNGEGGSILNCTIMGNRAATGGGIYCKLDSTDVTINNCIVRSNRAWNAPEVCCTGSDGDVLVDYTDFNDRPENVSIDPELRLDWGPGNIDADPCFLEAGSWDANSTPDDANDDFWVEGDYHLLPHSVCINSGDPNYVVGLGETDIDGQPRVFDGRIDMGADEFVPRVYCEMKFRPRALNLRSKGKYVKVHFLLPEGFAADEVDTGSPAVIEPLGIESEHIKVVGGEQNRVEVSAVFARKAFCGQGDFDGSVSVEGLLKNGQTFYGTDQIKIIDRSSGQIAALARCWLRSDCRPPDWCDGLDINGDSVVNFADFAGLNTCCIEAGVQ